MHIGGEPSRDLEIMTAPKLLTGASTGLPPERLAPVVGGVTPGSSLMAVMLPLMPVGPRGRVL
jgi:hypothetical protein